MQDLALQYTPDGGFAGAGSFESVPVKASITRTEEGYKVNVVDAKNNRILGVEFFNRKGSSESGGA